MIERGMIKDTFLIKWMKVKKKENCTSCVIHTSPRHKSTGTQPGIQLPDSLGISYWILVATTRSLKTLHEMTTEHFQNWYCPTSG